MVDWFFLSVSFQKQLHNLMKYVRLILCLAYCCIFLTITGSIRKRTDLSCSAAPFMNYDQ